MFGCKEVKKNCNYCETEYTPRSGYDCYCHECIKLRKIGHLHNFGNYFGTKEEDQVRALTQLVSSKIISVDKFIEKREIIFKQYKIKVAKIKKEQAEYEAKELKKNLKIVGNIK